MLVQLSWSPRQSSYEQVDHSVLLVAGLRVAVHKCACHHQLYPLNTTVLCSSKEQNVMIKSWVEIWWTHSERNDILQFNHCQPISRKMDFWLVKKWKLESKQSSCPNKINHTKSSSWHIITTTLRILIFDMKVNSGKGTAKNWRNWRMRVCIPATQVSCGWTIVFGAGMWMKSFFMKCKQVHININWIMTIDIDHVTTLWRYSMTSSKWFSVPIIFNYIQHIYKHCGNIRFL